MAPQFDRLDFSRLSEDYQFLAPLILSVPELRDVWTLATEGRLEGPAIELAFKDTNWWNQNNKYARRAFAEYQLSKQGQSADWQLRLDEAGALVDQYATELGSQLTPEERDKYVQQVIYQGWDQQGRQRFLQQALADEIAAGEVGGRQGMIGGKSGSFVDTLRDLAMRNGVRYTDEWFISAAKDVARGDSTEDDWIRSIQEQAAGLFPVFSKQIRSGVTAFDLASPYINTMAQELELNPGSITLDDPYIRQALGGVDKDGNPAATSLWDFTRKLRDDPRWMNTRYAQNQVTGIADAVMQMFGLRG